MITFEILSQFYQLVLNALKSNDNIKENVTNIYDCVPEKVSLPYIYFHITDCRKLENITNVILRLNLTCDIYSLEIANLLKLISTVNEVLIKSDFTSIGLEVRMISSNNCNIRQIKGGVMYAVLKFAILVKKKS